MKISWIEPHILAASGIPLDAKDMHALAAQGVRAIISLTEQPLVAQREITPALLTALDMTVHHVPIPDQFPPTHDQAHAILHIMAAMARDQRPVLVHCHAGIGRTGTILHLYYVAQQYSFHAARDKIRRKRVQCILLSPAQEAFVQAFTVAYEDSCAPPDNQSHTT